MPKRIRLCRIPWLGEVLVRGLNGFVLAALVFATSQHRRFFQARAEVAQGYLAPYHNWQSRIAIHRFIQDIPLESDHPSRRTLDEIEAGLSQLARHPMLIMWGADDFCFTQTHFLPEWRKRFPQAHVQVIRKAGHYVVEDAHEQIIPAMLGFLEKVYRESKV